LLPEALRLEEEKKIRNKLEESLVNRAGILAGLRPGELSFDSLIAERSAVESHRSLVEMWAPKNRDKPQALAAADSRLEVIRQRWENRIAKREVVLSLTGAYAGIWPTIQELEKAKSELDGLPTGLQETRLMMESLCVKHREICGQPNPTYVQLGGALHRIQPGGFSPDRVLVEGQLHAMGGTLAREKEIRERLEVKKELLNTFLMVHCTLGERNGGGNDGKDFGAQMGGEKRETKWGMEDEIHKVRSHCSALLTPTPASL